MSLPGIGGTSRNQALSRGLHVLKMVVDEEAPLTGSEVARRLGVHQSSASRILTTLSESGYIRKDTSGAFVPEYGVFALALAAGRVPFLRAARAPIEEIATEQPGVMLAMAVLWREELIYLLRARQGTETVTFWTGTWPLNVSILGLKLLLPLPEDDALRILRASRARYGWGGDPSVVPSTEAGVLAAARQAHSDDILVLQDWLYPGHIAGAIDVQTPEPHPVALAVVDDHDGAFTPDQLKLLLHQARRRIEQSF
ncbi:helix-turn-helix domain-containing protein [Occultella aeris]|uniref:DNA-binding transcriptional activator MhpR n=1 Tax=Occultella aeris TaxID=2761496 RepID=A0A7M4DH30_9MICO|nr:helix-turn-helix domain-containing protein [Occultella aeris]VZO36223.1 DNA-binding transcriptional activator MhpR [Occultella aeris]